MKEAAERRAAARDVVKRMKEVLKLLELAESLSAFAHEALALAEGGAETPPKKAYALSRRIAF